MDNILLNETQILNSARKAFEFLDSDYDANDLYQVEKMSLEETRLGSAQDITFFYMGSHLSELKSCALIFSTNFYFIFTFK